MATVALVLWAVLGLLGFGGRALLQRRLTGSWGIHGISGRPGSAEWLGGVLFLLALALAVAAPVLDLTDTLDPVGFLDRGEAQAAGLALYALGLVGTLGSQIAMGASWRVGVEPSERTELITGGPFALVRNPIYAAMVPAVAGLVLLVPNVVGLAGLALLVVALEIQVRMVEEPHLLRAHGSAYAGYARRVGRFVPGVGRLRGPA